MRNIITTLCLLLAGIYCNGQTLDLIRVLGSTTILSGTEFVIQLKVTSIPQECTSQDIAVNIGSLSYVGALLPAGVTIASAPGSTGVITISNITNIGTGGQSGTIDIKVKFLIGTCNNQPQEITANLISNGCSIAPKAAIPVTVFASTVNYYGTTIAHASNEPAEICIGKIVKYDIEAKNNGFGDFLENTKLYVELSKCAEIIGVYRSYTYNAVPINATQIGASTQTINWNVPDMVYSTNPPSYPEKYQLYVRYPCNSGCVSGLNDVNVHLEGNSLCNSTLVQTATHHINTNLGASNCGSCGSGGQNLISKYIELPCPECPSKLPMAQFTVDVAPSYNGPARFELKIPDGLDFNSSYLPQPCPPDVEYKDSSVPAQWRSNIALVTGRITDIRWTFTCTTLPFVATFHIDFNYSSTNPPLPQAELDFDVSLQTDANASPMVLSYKEIIEICQPIPNIFKFVRKKEVPFSALSSTDYFHDEEGQPGHEFTYLLTIENNQGTSPTGITIIKDILSPNLSYTGGFRYAYESGNNPVFTDVTNSIDDSELGDGATIYFNSETNELTISGLNIPGNCGTTPNTKVLYLEFNVKINGGVAYQTNILNNFKIIYGGNEKISNTRKIKVASLYSVTSILTAKCSLLEEYTEGPIYTRNGHKIDFRMRIDNVGSLPVSVKSLLNLKPQVGDLHEFERNPRGSAYTINYDCSMSPVVTSSSTVSTIEVSYSDNGVNMYRNMLCPIQDGPENTPDFPIWSAPCSTDANWMKIEFPDNVELAAGGFLEVDFRGTPIGAVGSLDAYNSFAFKIDNCHLDSDNSNDVNIINNGLGCVPPPPCTYCASFSLVKREKYLVSGWVKESDPEAAKEQYKNYTQSYIGLTFKDNNANVLDTPLKFYPSGDIIDGWQRIIGEFIVPSNVDDMFLELVNESSGRMVYFDDIRVLPTKSNMKSFVYDQETQRLMAELDENNYATFYEYDPEGGLIRVKKETEKGVFTIQETRSSNHK